MNIDYIYNNSDNLWDFFNVWGIKMSEITYDNSICQRMMVELKQSEVTALSRKWQEYLLVSEFDQLKIDVATQNMKKEKKGQHCKMYYSQKSESKWHYKNTESIQKKGPQDRKDEYKANKMSIRQTRWQIKA